MRLSVGTTLQPLAPGDNTTIDRMGQVGLINGRARADDIVEVRDFTLAADLGDMTSVAQVIRLELEPTAYSLEGITYCYPVTTMSIQPQGQRLEGATLSRTLRVPGSTQRKDVHHRRDSLAASPAGQANHPKRTSF